MSTIIFGNGGEITIDENGKVLRYDWSEDVATGEHEGYNDIEEFDVSKYRDTYKRVLPDHIDILYIGYWTTDGYYEPPISDADIMSDPVPGERK